MGAVSTQYFGNQATVVDAAGASRTHFFDALGRLVRVRENGINSETCYKYDALDNLIEARQNPAVAGGACSGGQLRTFQYDSLWRLAQAVNPESGAVVYTYDDNGNLKTRTDARGVTTTNSHDGLNRLTSTTYSDATPTTTFEYDAVAAGCNNQGRLTRVVNGVSTTEFPCYDALGRATASGRRRPAGRSNSPTPTISPTGSRAKLIPLGTGGPR